MKNLIKFITTCIAIYAGGYISHTYISDGGTFTHNLLTFFIGYYAAEQSKIDELFLGKRND